jgi:hypothetical protein
MALSFGILLRRLKIWKEQAYGWPFCPDLKKVWKRDDEFSCLPSLPLYILKDSKN